jgi:hypothetical protein
VRIFLLRVDAKRRRRRQRVRLHALGRALPVPREAVSKGSFTEREAGRPSSASCCLFPGERPESGSPQRVLLQYQRKDSWLATQMAQT